MDHVWTRDRPLRWLLIDEYTDTPGIAMGVCADIDGLFAAPEPLPEPERFTLLGCDPAGPLREALDAAPAPHGVGAWLPTVMLDPQRPPPHGCERYDTGCSCSEELFDVEVLGHRPSSEGHGLVDVELRGRLRILPETHWPPAQPPEAQSFLLHGQAGEPLGTCRRTTGVGGVLRRHRSDPLPAGPRAPRHHPRRRFRRAVPRRSPRDLGPLARGAALTAQPLGRVRPPPAARMGRHLVPGYDRPAYALRSWRPAVTLDELLGMFAEVDVTVELR
ncbi:hypothetical protein [Microbispora hainanensis]|uniref:Uncharacterized protein n=1 Tax=Microbispora hainanensis TaxID=568844 RepID=A0A544YR79_9ACTN|nr:hypothetical protein [Microbispora hainanensis]TQS19295.1 hypothetical protein FLX08_20800 [Microbispora hainanensis]